MAEIIPFPTQMVNFEKALNQIIIDYYSETPEQKNAAEDAGADIIQIVRDLNNQKPVFNLSVNSFDPAEVKDAIETEVMKFSDEYSRIITSLLAKLFKEKYNSKLKSSWSAT